jgi:hypothetical protein
MPDDEKGKEVEPAPLEGRIISRGERDGIRLAEMLGLIGKKFTMSPDGEITINIDDMD